MGVMTPFKHIHFQGSNGTFSWKISVINLEHLISEQSSI